MGMGILEGATPQATPPNAISNMMRGMSGARDNRYQQEQRMLQKQQAKMQLQQMKRAEEEHAYKLKTRADKANQLAAIRKVSMPNFFNQTLAEQPATQFLASPAASGGAGTNSPDINSLPEVGEPQFVSNNAPQAGGPLSGFQRTDMGVEQPENILSPYAQSLILPLNLQEQKLQVILETTNDLDEYTATQSALLTLQQDKAKAELLVGIGEDLPAGERERFYNNPSTYMSTRMAPSKAMQEYKLSEKNSGPFKETRNENGMDYEFTGTRDLGGNETIYSKTPKPDSPEKVAKLQMLKTAQSAYYGSQNKETGEFTGGAKSFIYNEDGTPDKRAILLAALPVPLGDGRPIATRMEFGIQAITRGETGAAMPASEVANTRVRFMPSVLDSDEDIALKLQMFEMFINGSVDLLDRNQGEGGYHKFNPAKYEKEMSKLRAKKSDEDPFGIL
jgi:hypothetical protein